MKIHGMRKICSYITSLGCPSKKVLALGGVISLLAFGVGWSDPSKSLNELIYRWQSLLAGLAAITAAIITINEMNNIDRLQADRFERQINQQNELEEKQSRRFFEQNALMLRTEKRTLERVVDLYYDLASFHGRSLEGAGLFPSELQKRLSLPPNQTLTLSDISNDDLAWLIKYHVAGRFGAEMIANALNESVTQEAAKLFSRNVDSAMSDCRLSLERVVNTQVHEIDRKYRTNPVKSVINDNEFFSLVVTTPALCTYADESFEALRKSLQQLFESYPPSDTFRITTIRPYPFPRGPHP